MNRGCPPTRNLDSIHQSRSAMIASRRSSGTRASIKILLETNRFNRRKPLDRLEACRQRTRAHAEQQIVDTTIESLGHPTGRKPRGIVSGIARRS
jgi:hypothetical protein